MSTRTIPPGSLEREAFIAEALRLEVSHEQLLDEYLKIKLADGIAAHTQNAELIELSRDYQQRANKHLIELLDQAVESRLNNVLAVSRTRMEGEN